MNQPIYPPETVQPTALAVYPIGTVRRTAQGIFLEIASPYRPALQELEHFSHVMVFAWANFCDTPEYRQVIQCNPPYAADHTSGIFATRSPVRPNPILMTTCKLIQVDQAQGRVQVGNLDFLDGTPLLDLKAYFPVCDRVQDAHIPAWLAGWPEWLPEEGIGLEEYEQ